MWARASAPSCAARGPFTDRIGPTHQARPASGRRASANHFPYRDPRMPDTAVTIGTFDGAHLGHAALVERARQRVGDAGRVVVLAFDPHPAAVIAPERTPPLLTAFDRRAELLKAVGADEVIRLDPRPSTDHPRSDLAWTRNLLALEAEDFVAKLVQSFQPTVVIEGSDFRFGARRRGDVTFLSELGRSQGFEVDLVPPVHAALRDQSVVRVSSTLARWLLGHGRVRDVAALLGRPYELNGPVVRGDQLGRTIGFPTANLSHAETAPAAGVYAGLAELPDGRTLPTAVGIGKRPTVNGVEPRTEAYIIDRAQTGDWAPLDGLPEYDWPLRLKLVAWLRDEVKFASFDLMRDQIVRDVARTKTLAREAAAAYTPHHSPDQEGAPA